jgi:hypothetical protein
MTTEAYEDIDEEMIERYNRFIEENNEALSGFEGYAGSSSSSDSYQSSIIKDKDDFRRKVEDYQEWSDISRRLLDSDEDSDEPVEVPQSQKRKTQKNPNPLHATAKRKRMIKSESSNASSSCRVKCEYCESVILKSNMRRHLNTIHKLSRAKVDKILDAIKKEPQEAEKKEPLEADKKPERTVKKELLTTIHKNSKKKRSDQLIADGIQPKGQKSSYFCLPDCGRTFLSHSVFVMHQNQHKGEMQSRSFYISGFTCLPAASLKANTSRVNNDSLKFCTVCKIQFTSLRDFNQHSMVHSGETR